PPVTSTLSDALAGLDPEAAAVAARARAVLAGAGRLGVAYSGGVDSAVLLALAVAELGAEQVVAILGISASLAADDRAAAHEEDGAGYRANAVDRCFFCKGERFARISAEVVTEHVLDSVAYGENADDARRPDRPGARAATNHRVLRPLAEAGASKAVVRQIA